MPELAAPPLPRRVYGTHLPPEVYEGRHRKAEEIWDVATLERVLALLRTWDPE